MKEAIESTAPPVQPPPSSLNEGLPGPQNNDVVPLRPNPSPNPLEGQQNIPKDIPKNEDPNYPPPYDPPPFDNPPYDGNPYPPSQKYPEDSFDSYPDDELPPLSPPMPLSPQAGGPQPYPQSEFQYPGPEEF